MASASTCRVIPRSAAAASTCQRVRIRVSSSRAEMGLGFCNYFLPRGKPARKSARSENTNKPGERPRCCRNTRLPSHVLHDSPQVERRGGDIQQPLFDSIEHEDVLHRPSHLRPRQIFDSCSSGRCFGRFSPTQVYSWPLIQGSAHRSRGGRCALARLVAAAEGDCEQLLDVVGILRAAAPNKLDIPHDAIQRVSNLVAELRKSRGKCRRFRWAPSKCFSRDERIADCPALSQEVNRRVGHQKQGADSPGRAGGSGPG